MKNITNIEIGKSKLNKDKCHFRCTSVPFLGKFILRQGMRHDLRKLEALTNMQAP